MIECILYHIYIHDIVYFQSQQQFRQRLDQRGEEETEGGRTYTSLQTRLVEAEAALERERSKVKQLEGELVTHSVVKEGMDRDAEKVSNLNSTPSLHITA